MSRILLALTRDEYGLWASARRRKKGLADAPGPFVLKNSIPDYEQVATILGVELPILANREWRIGGSQSQP